MARWGGNMPPRSAAGGKPMDGPAPILRLALAHPNVWPALQTPENFQVPTTLPPQGLRLRR